ncbi:MAG: hypothetical protein ABL308_02605 [Oceanicaulis sp.]
MTARLAALLAAASALTLAACDTGAGETPAAPDSVPAEDTTLDGATTPVEGETPEAVVDGEGDTAPQDAQIAEEPGLDAETEETMPDPVADPLEPGAPDGEEPAEEPTAEPGQDG